MRAFRSHIAGLCLGVCGALSSGVASAVDCPVYPSPGILLIDWPTTHTGSGNVSRTSSPCGGATINGEFTLTGGPYTDMGAAVSAAATQIAIRYAGEDNIEVSKIADSGTSLTYCVVLDTGPPANALRSVRLNQNLTATPCEPPPGEDEMCGGNGVTPGEEVTEEQRGLDMWTTFRVRATEWGGPSGAASQVPDCVPMGGPGTTDGCTLTGVYKAGPGLDKDEGGTYEFLANVRLGGGWCSPGAEEPQEEEVQDFPVGEDCNTSAAANEYCHSNEDPENEGDDCGWYNDVLVCTDRTDEDECWVNDDGSRYCGENAPMPPVPDNGTGGVPAEPDDEIIDPDTGNEYDYYDGDTVGGSSRPPGDSGANPNRPGSTNPSTEPTPVVDVGDGDGDGDGEGDGDESVGGGGDCDVAPTCEGDVIDCAILDQEWRARCPDELSDEDLLGEFGESFGEGEHEGFGSGTEIEIPEGLSADGWLGGGAECLSDFVLELGGDLPDVEIPLSEWCEWMSIIGMLVMVSAYLSAGRILFGVI